MLLISTHIVTVTDMDCFSMLGSQRPAQTTTHPLFPHPRAPATQLRILLQVHSVGLHVPASCTGWLLFLCILPLTFFTWCISSLLSLKSNFPFPWPCPDSIMELGVLNSSLSTYILTFFATFRKARYPACMQTRFSQQRWSIHRSPEACPRTCQQYMTHFTLCQCYLYLLLSCGLGTPCMQVSLLYDTFHHWSLGSHLGLNMWTHGYHCCPLP